MFRVCLLFVALFFGYENLLGHEFLKNGVTAHRGSSIEFPENTLTSIAAGIRDGADWVEVDLHLTRDGKLVICHDANTAKVAEKSLVIAHSSLEELRQLDVAYQFRRSRKLNFDVCPVERMPTLEEALGLILAQKKTRLSLQPKDESVAAAMDVIRKHNAQAWVGFNDGSLPKMKLVKSLEPEIHVFWDRPAKLDLKTDLRIAHELRFESLVFHHQAITPELIQTVKSRGFEVGAWTVNAPAMMDQFTSWGIDRLYTDAPKAAHASFAKHRATSTN